MSAKSAEKEKPKFDKTQLSPRHTREAIELWERGEASLATLSKKFKKHPDTFRRLFKRVGAVKGSKAAALAEKIAAEQDKQLAAEAAEMTRKIKETREGPYRMLKAIEALVAHTINKARDEGRPMSTTEKDMKALKTAAETVEISRRGRFEILGLDNKELDDDELPDLNVRVLTDEAIREAANAAMEEDTDDAAIDDLEEGLEDDADPDAEEGQPAA